MKPITTLGEVSSKMKTMLSGIQSIAKITVAFNHILGICYFFSAGISYNAWFLDTNGKIGEIRNK